MKQFVQLVLSFGFCLFGTGIVYAQHINRKPLNQRTAILPTSLPSKRVTAPPAKPIVTKNTSTPVETRRVSYQKALNVAPVESTKLSATATSSLQKAELTNPNDKKRVEMSWGLLMDAGFTRTELAERRDVVSTVIKFNLKVNLSEWAYIRANPKLNFVSGHYQAATPTNGRDYALGLSSADFTFSDANFFSASAGLLEFSNHHSALLTETVMPAANVFLSTGETNTLSAGLFGNAGVPGSNTDTNNSEEAGKTPNFASAGLRLRLKTERFEGKIQGAAFSYKDLPSSIATDSVLLGNTASADSATTPVRKFEYQFRGYEGLLAFGWQMSPSIKWSFQGAFVRNQEAPNELNQGYSIGNDFEFGLNANWKIIPSYLYYRVEPDATVANFNSEYMTTNHVGYRGGLAFQYKDQVKFGGVYGERNILFESAAQGLEKYVGLTLEALNVAF